MFHFDVFTFNENLKLLFYDKIFYNTHFFIVTLLSLLRQNSLYLAVLFFSNILHEIVFILMIMLFSMSIITKVSANDTPI
jgi:hypothetical protein